MKILFYFIIILSILLGSWYLLNGSIIFHTDIARDFLLIEDIVKNKPFTLIGPRSGGIPGVFHGPLWLYLNVPAFIMGRGSPLAVGLFWLLLSGANLFIIYRVAEKIFKDRQTALYSVALVAAATIPDTRALFNPWGAVMLTPVFFYFYYRYIHNQKPWFLLGSFLIVGLIIQFQMAFGVPILILTLIHSLSVIYRNRKYSHMITLLIVLLPLSTFILFDLKHDFLQSRAVIDFIAGKVNTGKVEMTFPDLLDDRYRRIFTDGLGFITFNRWFLLVPILFLFFRAGENIVKIKNTGVRSAFLLFLYFYLGFWVLTLGFKGQIWSYYHWPFLGLISIFFASLHKYADKKLFYGIFLTVLILNIFNGFEKVGKNKNFIAEDGGSWKFYERMADDIYKDAGQEFGYYIFSGDQFGYTQRYAMNFKQMKFPKIKAYSFSKRQVVYLILTPTDNPFLNEDGWKAGQVKLVKKPTKVISYKNGIKVERYELSDDEIKISSDPNMIGATLIFR